MIIRVCFIMWVFSKDLFFSLGCTCYYVYSLMLYPLGSTLKTYSKAWCSTHWVYCIWPKLGTFQTNYHALAFLSCFAKLAESVSFCENAWKIIDLTKTSNFSNKLPCFSIIFHLVFSKNLQKVSHIIIVKNHYKSLILVKTCSFSNKLPCFSIFINSLARSCKNCLISWKSRRTIVLATTWQFLNKLSHFRVSLNVLAKSGIKYLILLKTMRNRGLGQNLTLFKQSMFLRFLKRFVQKWEKVAYFFKSHEKSRIGTKLARFRTVYQVLGFSATFHPKVCIKCLILWKIIDLAKTSNFLDKLTFFL